MRISIDLDGVLCEIDKTKKYDELLPIPGAAEALRKLKEDGHYLIIHTARHMKTTESNVGKILAIQGLVTLTWLLKYHFVYDEIYFGKPWADLYIDDNAARFSDWHQTLALIAEVKN